MASNLQGKRVAILVTDGFEQSELLEPRKALDEAGANTQVVSPAGKKVKLIVENKDATPEEFESAQLKVEKVIAGKSKATIYVGPLKAGEYKFVGEYNEKTAKGVVVAK